MGKRDDLVKSRVFGGIINALHNSILFGLLVFGCSNQPTGRIAMKLLVTVNISKGFATWVQMHEGLTPEMEKVGVKLIWAGTNPDESKVLP